MNNNPAEAQQQGGAGPSGGTARVQFRVRCESLGHGEAVYLVPQEDGSGLSPTAAGAAGGAGVGAGSSASSGGAGPASSKPRMIPLHTTASRYPWYFTRTPINLPLPGGPLGAGGASAVEGVDVGAATAALLGGGLGGATAAANQNQQQQQQQPGLPPAGPGRMGLPLPSRPASSAPAAEEADKARQFFRYRYAIYRAGVFHRWEQPTDGPADGDADAMMAAADDEDTEQQQQRDVAAAAAEEGKPHQLSLRLLAKNELYQLSDVLGQPAHHPELEHIRVRTLGGASSVASLHSRQDSHSRNSRGNLGGHGTPGNSQHNLLERRNSENKVGGGAGGGGGKNKAVGFAPQPVPYHRDSSDSPRSGGNAGGGGGGGSLHGFKSPSGPTTKQIHLNSTDGLVVASAFLPVHLHRTETPHPTNPTGPPQVSWSADWDYEALLSMQTHLRVTRVGVVKWRGWHGNVGKDGSPSKGVPVEERHLVERCLEPFNCIPVWIEPRLFGEM